MYNPGQRDGEEGEGRGGRMKAEHTHTKKKRSEMEASRAKNEGRGWRERQSTGGSFSSCWFSLLLLPARTACQVFCAALCTCVHVRALELILSTLEEEA